MAHQNGDVTYLGSGLWARPDWLLLLLLLLLITQNDHREKQDARSSKTARNNMSSNPGAAAGAAATTDSQHPLPGNTPSHTPMEDYERKIADLEKDLRSYSVSIQKAKSPRIKKKLREQAMQTLKRKRQVEKLLDQTTQQQVNMDQLQFQLESAQATGATIRSLHQAREELRRTVMPVGDVQDLQLDMEEAMEEMDHVGSAMSQRYATPFDLDEDDLEAEFLLLEDEFDEDHDCSKLSVMPNLGIQRPPSPQSVATSRHSTVPRNKRSSSSSTQSVATKSTLGYSTMSRKQQQQQEDDVTLGSTKSRGFGPGGSPHEPYQMRDDLSNDGMDRPVDVETRTEGSVGKDHFGDLQPSSVASMDPSATRSTSSNRGIPTTSPPSITSRGSTMVSQQHGSPTVSSHTSHRNSTDLSVAGKSLRQDPSSHSILTAHAGNTSPPGAITIPQEGDLNSVGNSARPQEASITKPVSPLKSFMEKFRQMGTNNTERERSGQHSENGRATTGLERDDIYRA